MSNKVMIVGTGNVGMSFGYTLINQRTSVNELVLVDINQADAEGEAMDLNDALAVAPSYLKIKSGTYADASGCDIIVITAGVPQKPGESRLDLLKKNAAIFKDMIQEIMQTGFTGIFVVVSNPVDVMTYLVWKYSSLPSERVIGSGTVLDSARLRQHVSERLNIHPKSIHAYQIGEHGDSELTAWSSANVGGEAIGNLLDQDTLDQIEDLTRKEAYAIIEKKGATYYGIGACIAKIINCILSDENRIMPVSAYDELSQTYNGFPAIVGRQGIIKRIGLKLSAAEQDKFNRSIDVIRTAIKEAEN